MKHPIENKGQMPIYVAGVMIPPGETMHFEDWQLPPEHKPAAEVPEVPAAPNPLAEILKAGAKEVIAGLAALSVEELTALAALEADGKARKTVVEAIEAEKLLRVKTAVESTGEGSTGGEGQAGNGEGADGAGGEGQEGGAGA